MHKITIIDKDFQEKSLELSHTQLIELYKWLNIYLNSGKVFQGRIRKKILSNVNVEQKNIQM
jgi:hypothetical protein